MKPPVSGATPLAGDVAIRFATSADATLCCDFHNRYYGHDRTPAQWQWEFVRYRDATGRIPYAIAECDGQIVGTQALIPIQMIDTDGMFWSAKSEDTLVAPSMRGRAVFSRLYAPLFDWARAFGVAVVWGFTPAATAFAREGFSAPSLTAQLLRAFRPSAARTLNPAAPWPMMAVGTSASVALAIGGHLLSAIANRRKDPRITVAAIDAAPMWADDLSVRFIAQWGGATIHRSMKYCQWRVFDNPYYRPTLVAAFAEGLPVGWVCFGTEPNGCAAVVDAIAVDSPTRSVTAREVARTLISFAVTHSEHAGACAIRAWDVTNHPFASMLRRELRRLGWIRLARGNHVVSRHLPAQSRRLAEPVGNWYVSRLFTEGVTA